MHAGARKPCLKLREVYHLMIMSHSKHQRTPNGRPVRPAHPRVLCSDPWCRRAFSKHHHAQLSGPPTDAQSQSRRRACCDITYRSEPRYIHDNRAHRHVLEVPCSDLNFPCSLVAGGFLAHSAAHFLLVFYFPLCGFSVSSLIVLSPPPLHLDCRIGRLPAPPLP